MRYDYLQSREIDAKQYSFYALLMALMRNADSYNLEKLKREFPEVWDEMYARYHAPGGYLRSEIDELERQYPKGMQIAYIPNHADGNINHPDVEFGFIQELTPNRHFAVCRYWSKSNPGRLRTIANGEKTPFENIVKHQLYDQKEIDRLLDFY